MASHNFRGSHDEIQIKIHSLHFTHVMAMMLSMRVVIADDSAIVALENAVVNVCQVVTHYLAGFVHPNFPTQSSIAALWRKREGIIDDFDISHDK